MLQGVVLRLFDLLAYYVPLAVLTVLVIRVKPWKTGLRGFVWFACIVLLFLLLYGSLIWLLSIYDDKAFSRAHGGHVLMSILYYVIIAAVVAVSLLVVGAVLKVLEKIRK